jgi:hypothetical protein
VAVARGWYGGNKKYITGLCWEYQREWDHLEDIGVGRMIILNFDLQEIVWEGADCFHLAQKRANCVLL